MDRRQFFRGRCLIYSTLSTCHQYFAKSEFSYDAWKCWDSEVSHEDWQWIWGRRAHNSKTADDHNCPVDNVERSTSTDWQTADIDTTKINDGIYQEKLKQYWVKVEFTVDSERRWVTTKRSRQLGVSTHHQATMAFSSVLHASATQQWLSLKHSDVT